MIEQRPIEYIGLATVFRSDLLERALRSIDYPVNIVHVVSCGVFPQMEAFLRNLQFKLVNELTNIRQLIVTRYSYVCSDCEAYNLHVKQFPNLPYWLYSQDDIYFMPGTLARMASTIHDNLDKYQFFGVTPGYIQVWTNILPRTVGLFDENFFPCCFGDCDYWYRAVGLHKVPFLEINNAGVIHGDDTTTKSCTSLHVHRQVQFEMNRDYFIAKWGDEPGKEVFKTPFNNPNLKPSYWELDVTRRGKIAALSPEGLI